MQLPLNT